MELDKARDFLSQNQRIVMLTWRQDGRPQMSPMMCGLDDDGRVLISTRETAMKTHNLHRDPRVSLCGLTDDFFSGFVQIDGTAEIIAQPEAMEMLVEFYRSLRGEHPDWDEYRESMRTEKRVMVRITIEHAGPDRAG